MQANRLGKEDTMRCWRRLGLLTLIAVGLAACGPSGSDAPLPTLVDINQLPTAMFLTQNAPPPGFGDVNFDPIDRFLSDHPGWTYVLTGSFEGTLDSTSEPATGTFEVRVQSNEPGETRRVVLDVSGSAFLEDAGLFRLEGVRWSNDYYVVDVNGRCSQDEEGGAAIADLSAGQIIGGVNRAVPTGYHQDIEGVPAWQYAFAPDAVRLPAVRQDTTSVVALEADLWIAPGINAALRYEVRATVSHVRLLWAAPDSSPVSGTLYLRYDLSLPDLDIMPNISVPHGC
jgi:hypothetical protein